MVALSQGTDMKTIITIVALLGLVVGVACTGCSTTPSGGAQNSFGFNCETAQRAYAAYLATQLVREPSEDEKKYAAAAGAFLSIYCNWVPPAQVKGTKSLPSFAPKDSHGVPVLVPPQ